MADARSRGGDDGGARGVRFGCGERQGRVVERESRRDQPDHVARHHRPEPGQHGDQPVRRRLREDHPGDTITINYIENQSYKQKIQLAMGAGNPPTIFWTWGGGPLKQFIDAGDVASLGHPGYASNFLPSSLGAVTFDGKLYGVPIQGTQPR
jgi:hypothetical protein